MASIQERKGRDGKIVYRVQIRIKGASIQRATFERKTDAKLWAQQTEADIRAGRHFKSTEAKKHTFAEFIDRYITEILLFNKKKCVKAQQPQLIWWKNEFGSYLLADITPAMIAERRDKLLHGITKKGTQRSPATVVRYMAALSHAFTICINEWGWLEDSPIKKVKKPKEPRGIVRFLDEGERFRLLAVCKESSNPMLYIVVMIALSTGMRQAEIMNLKWQDIDFERERIILHETKNGERRSVPLKGMCLELVKEYAHKSCNFAGLLFPSTKPHHPPKPIDLRFSWEHALKKANIKNFRFHDLRHSAASYLAMAGATCIEISNILGHKTLNMVKRYSHLSENHASNAIASMNQKFLATGGLSENLQVLNN